MMKLLTLCFFTVVSLTSCTYMKYVSVHAEYERIQKAKPAQKNLKHMIDQENYYVVGSTTSGSCDCYSYPMSIAAYSNRYKRFERVDTMHFASSGTHFGLNLPAGNYELLVFADKNRNQLFERAEVVGRRSIALGAEESPENVLTDVEIELALPVEVEGIETFEVLEPAEFKKSYFFPGTAIRSLNDRIFDQGISTLGMYDPAAFFEISPTGFYALEEYSPFKIPVIFVHGIGGSAREFKSIVEQIDRRRFQPWFFHYASGGDLDQLAELFYQIYLSGKVASMEEMPIVIVAHSMGGLVVREAFNRYKNNSRENKVAQLITIATPFMGHPGAAMGEKHGIIVLPAWRDLNPENDFMKNLYRKPLPADTQYNLIYAYQNKKALKFGENTDGVVPLSSQLRSEAQEEAREQFGFNNTHTGVLQSEKLIAYIQKHINALLELFPEAHLKLLDEGGFDVAMEGYSPTSQHIIRVMGKYLAALTTGEITPLTASLQQFTEVAKGQKSASSRIEKDWLKFIREYPELVGRGLNLDL